MTPKFPSLAVKKSIFCLKFEDSGNFCIYLNYLMPKYVKGVLNKNIEVAKDCLLKKTVCLLPEENSEHFHHLPLYISSFVGAAVVSEAEAAVGKEPSVPGSTPPE